MWSIGLLEKPFIKIQEEILELKLIFLMLNWSDLQLYCTGDNSIPFMNTCLNLWMYNCRLVHYNYLVRVTQIFFEHNVKVQNVCYSCILVLLYNLYICIDIINIVFFILCKKTYQYSRECYKYNSPVLFYEPQHFYPSPARYVMYV